MTKPILANHNALTLLDSGVWVKADEAERSFIDYTDGDSTENLVYSRVVSANDRSVFSQELDHVWENWALEYHLGSKRSNLYRGLNLEGVKTVLEVGCGCGAITRYLGEQGFQVDAIEGTLRRAQIARLRTEELENVQIISSNYHDLMLPEHEYDLVVFTGVLEYSGAYAPDGVGPEAQLEATLQRARAAMSEHGQILIAIENRTGFKYLAGASEDHLNVPNIGLLEYAEPLSHAMTRGIRTWSKKEWRFMLEKFGFDEFEFCYPFPDYKVPDAIISDSFLATAHHPYQVLAGIHSRDYASIWWPDISESVFWKTAAQADSLDKFANSFLIILANSRDRLRRTVDFDFVRFASVQRKLPYRMQVVKKRGDQKVQRIPLADTARKDVSLVSQHHVIDENFVDGQMLEQLWSQALMVEPRYEELAEHIEAYALWLDKFIPEGAEKYIDALPRNIIVDDAGVWHLIDQEWHATEPIGKEVIIFRALFYYVLSARDALADMELNAARRTAGLTPGSYKFPLIQTLDDFVRWGFEVLGLDYVLHRETCMDFETSLHEQVSGRTFDVELRSMLMTPIYQWHGSQSFELPATPMEVRAFWTQLDGVFHLDHSVAVEATFEHGLNVSLDMPLALMTHRYLRIDPAADILQIYRGWLEFGGLSITVTHKSGDQHRVFHIADAETLFDRARIDGMRLLAGERLMLTTPSASFILDLEEVSWGDDVISIRLSLLMDIASDKNMMTARRILREESIRSAYRVGLRQHILDQQQRRIDAGEQRLRLLQNKISQSSTTALGRLLGRVGLMRKFKV